MAPFLLEFLLLQCALQLSRHGPGRFESAAEGSVSFRLCRFNQIGNEELCVADVKKAKVNINGRSNLA